MRFKQVINFPGYYINKQGRLWSAPKGRSNKKGKYLKPGTINEHFHVGLQRDGKQFSRYIHRLVLETFIGPCPEGMECRHLNGNSRDNNLSNLQWGTHKENGLDIVRHGSLKGKSIGEKSGRTKFTEQDVRTIVYMYSTGTFLQREIAEIYSVSRSTIEYIVTKRNWKHLWR